MQSSNFAQTNQISRINIDITDFDSSAANNNVLNAKIVNSIILLLIKMLLTDEALCKSN